MNSGEDPFNEVRDAFSDKQALIDELWNKDGEFRELCEAYYECTKARDHWRVTAGDFSGRAQEYSELLRKLFDDIQEFIERVE